MSEHPPDLFDEDGACTPPRAGSTGHELGGSSLASSAPRALPGSDDEWYSTADAAPVDSAGGERGRSGRRHVAIATLALLLIGGGLLTWRTLDSPPEHVGASPASAPQSPTAAIDSSTSGSQPSATSAPERCTGCAIPAAAVATTVLAVIDGDTLDTDDGRVRVFGINAPEVGKPLAEDATRRVEDLVPVGTTVLLWRSPGSDDRDRYDRLVRTVYREDGTDVGDDLVRAGLAVAFVQYSDRYLSAEGAAKAKRLGIWGSAKPFVATTPTATPDSPASDEPWNRPGPDLDCPDIGHRVTISGPDYHNLDLDGDGIGCDSYG